MNVQVIERDGQAEYAVLPWAEYQELLVAAGRQPAARASVPVSLEPPAFDLANLRRLREARNLAPEQLARAIGISPHYLAMIESGEREREPDQAIHRALVRVFAAPAEGQPG
ncbi:helix-turn-helix protein [compost metagenome]